MKKILQILIMSLLYWNTSFADDIRNFKIEEMSIGDSALEYFTEDQIENGEQGWYNYNYNEYSTSFLPGKKNYHLLEISYKSEDDKFVIEGITTTIDLHKKILNHKKFISSDFDVNWLTKEKFY